MLPEEDIVKHAAGCEEWLLDPANLALFNSLASESVRLHALSDLAAERAAPSEPVSPEVYLQLLRDQRFRCAKSGVRFLFYFITQCT